MGLFTPEWDALPAPRITPEEAYIFDLFYDPLNLRADGEREVGPFAIRAALDNPADPEMHVGRRILVLALAERHPR